MANDLTTSVFWDDRSVMKTRPPAGILRRIVRRKFDRLLRQFIDQVDNPRADVLEMGCAPGRMLERLYLVRPKAQLHGIDFSKVGVGVARKYLGNANIEASIYEGDIRTTELPYQCDLVVSFGLIEHFKNAVPIVRNHMRFCKPGGYVSLTVPNFATPVNKFLLHKFNPPAVDAHYLDIMNPTALRATLESAGLQNVQIGAVDGPRVFPHAHPSHRFSRLYDSLALAWNTYATLSPCNWPWHYTYWGSGQVPSESEG